MRLAIDTNAYRAAADGESRSVECLRRAEEIWLPYVVLGELGAGFALGTVGKKNEAKLTEFLNSPRVRALYRQGTPIPTNDLWIAALAVQHDLMLLSSDAHFSKIAQIMRL